METVYSHSDIIEALRGSQSPAAVIKDILSKTSEALRKTHLLGRTGMQVCKAHTGLVDEILRALFLFKAEELGCNESMAMVALGGYGRGELNLRSDLDLMLLYDRKISKKTEDLTQQILYILWDTGLDLGFSIRSVPESIELAREDLKTMTALLDLRLIHGDKRLFEKLGFRIKKDLFNKKGTAAFVNDKIEETRIRHEKYGGSVYILEPNVKEGEGGLRDLHTAMWVIKAHRHNHAQSAPFSLGLISEQESAKLTESLDFILWVRNELHFESKRKTDQLTFDHQERMAGLLGFTGGEHILAVEEFMQQYYRHASNVYQCTNLMLSRALHREEKRPFFWPKKQFKIDKNYTVSGSALSVKDPKAFEKDPATAMKAFEYSQSFDVEMDQAARDGILAFLDGAADGFRTSKAVSDCFLKILKGHNVFKPLSEMHRLRFLDKYIPEFGEISCRVQHDLYHIYTVDTHTLFAIRELERLRGQYKPEFPLLSTIFEELANPEILMLAVLFHDIGKAHGKGHAEKGAALVPGICERLGLPQESANLVRFLVKNHLLLADTAQYRDLHDEKLIIEFAKKIGDIERLNLLYLLTFADVRAVGPDVWSQWKGVLFQELYFKALTVLERGTFEVEDAGDKIRRTKQHVTGLLKPTGIGAQVVEEHFGLLPNNYFLSNGPDTIAEHIRVLNDFGGRPYLMTFRQDNFREYTEIVICAHDMHGLFSMITGVMAANAVNILGAQINTLKNGLVLDVLQVNSPQGVMITDESRFKKVEQDLSDVITGRVKVAALVGKRKPSILDRKAKPRVPTSVQIDNEVSDSYTVVDIHTQNRVGLLYDITSTLSRLGLYICVSKISTKGDEAADIFYVKDIFGQKIFYKERLKEITDTLFNVLTEAGREVKEKPSVEKIDI